MCPRGLHLAPVKQPDQPTHKGIPAPSSKDPLGTPHRQLNPKGKKIKPRVRAELEKVTCRPVTIFFPSERLTHCNRPGLAQTRAGGLEHAWTVSALSERLAREKVRGAETVALGSPHTQPGEPKGSKGQGGSLSSLPFRLLGALASHDHPKNSRELSPYVLSLVMMLPPHRSHMK